VNPYFIASFEVMSLIAQLVAQIDNRTGGSGEGEQAMNDAINALNGLKNSVQGLVDAPVAPTPETPVV
jgi:hypothetical protein